MNRKQRRYAEHSPYMQQWNMEAGKWERVLKKKQVSPTREQIDDYLERFAAECEARYAEDVRLAEICGANAEAVRESGRDALEHIRAGMKAPEQDAPS